LIDVGFHGFSTIPVAPTSPGGKRMMPPVNGIAIFADPVVQVVKSG
jgi:hypothetical protein